MSEYRSRFARRDKVIDIAIGYGFPMFLGLLLGSFLYVLVQVERTERRRATDCERHHGASASRVCVDSSTIRTLAPP